LGGRIKTRPKRFFFVVRERKRGSPYGNAANSDNSSHSAEWDKMVTQRVYGIAPSVQLHEPGTGHPYHGQRLDSRLQPPRLQNRTAQRCHRATGRWRFWRGRALPGYSHRCHDFGLHSMRTFQPNNPSHWRQDPVRSEPIRFTRQAQSTGRYYLARLT